MHTKVRLLGVDIDCLTMEQCVGFVVKMIESGKSGNVITLNPELLYRAVHGEPDINRLIAEANLVTPDGVGIVWAGKQAGYSFPERVTGIDLMFSLTERAASLGWKVFLFGASPGVAEEAAVRLCSLYPGLSIVGTRHGYFKPAEETDIVQTIKEKAPQLLFVALGAPAQEKWIDRNLKEIGATVAIGVGGSLDVISGHVERAPAWMRKLKIEWLGRLIREPSRWRRMLVLPKFAWLVIKTYRFRS